MMKRKTAVIIPTLPAENPRITRTARGSGGLRRRASRGAFAALLALALPIIGAQAANTVPTRAFTSEWECDNGRKVLFNAHPLRPKEEAWVTYIGNRAQVAANPKNPNRYQSQDEKVAWEMRGESATLVFRDLLPEPLKCKRIKTP